MTSRAKRLNTTSSLLDIEQSHGWQRIVTIDELSTMRELPGCIVYLLVTWSGPERVSRSIVYHALQSLEVKLPVFLIDCSERNKPFVEEWFQENAALPPYLYSQGGGETLYCQQGIIVNIIKNPAKLGSEDTKAKLSQWMDAILIK